MHGFLKLHHDCDSGLPDPHFAKGPNLVQKGAKKGQNSKTRDQIKG